MLQPHSVVKTVATLVWTLSAYKRLSSAFVLDTQIV